MHTHLAVTYLNRSGTRFNIKTITNQQLILNNNILDISDIGQTVRHCLLTVVSLNYTYSSWAVLIRHSKMYANSYPSILFQQFIVDFSAIVSKVLQLVLKFWNCSVLSKKRHSSLVGFNWLFLNKSIKHLLKS